MPEPVVVVWPATGPAGSSVGPVTPAEDAPSTREESGGAAGLPERAIAIRIIRGAAALLVRGFWAAGAATLRAFKRNPRTSLAAAASVLILGSIWVTQPHTGTGKRSLVTNEIAGNLFNPVAKNQKDSAGPKSEAAAVDPAKTASAQADATSQPILPSPMKSVDDESLPLSVADAPTTEQKQQTALEKSVTVSELASAPKAARTPAPAPVHDPASAPLLAAPVPDTALEPPLSVAQVDKGGAKPSQTVPPVDSPAPAPAFTTRSQPIEPAPAPALADQPVQLAPALESAGNQLPPAANPAPNHVAKSPGQDAATAERKPPEDPAPNKTKSIKNAVSSPKLDQAPKPNESTPKPESTEKDEKKPETSKSEMRKAVSSAPEPLARLKADEPAGKPTVPLLSRGAPAIHHDVAGAAALPVDGSTPRTEPVAPPAQDVAAGSEMPAQSSMARPDPGSPIPDPDERTTRIPELERRKPNSKPNGPHVEPSRRHDPATADWVSIPNTGKLPVDGGESIDARSGDADSESGSGTSMARDPRAHAAKNVSFEQESSLPRARPGAARNQSRSEERSVASAGPKQDLRAGPLSARVESVPHLVERGENFWIISRLYYDSGRYYHALWKANSEKYPDINVLHVGDTIMIPPVEDLDPAYILAPRTHTTSAFAGAQRRPDGRGDGIRRDDADDLSRNNDEPDTRTAARPRRSDTASPRRPVYKVRRHDTLRSIARDTLDDSRRASEILELNRGLVNDPTHLIVGQILELPEDARTTLRRSASRNY